ncbi:hypothetical protein K439DRAFT_1364037 [Ramaria rubella]|nr:hypothetical protein K439DRAFT_1364037 [Ramaria rubella]
MPSISKQTGVKRKLKNVPHVSQKHCRVDAPPSTPSLPISPCTGCVWDEANWSCRYDSVFMMFHTIYRNATDSWRFRSRTFSNLSHFLANAYDILLIDAQSTDGHIFNALRDTFRDSLFMLDPSTFPRLGRVEAAVSNIMDAMSGSTTNLRICTNITCTSCHLTTSETFYRSQSILCHPSLWSSVQYYSNTTTFINVQVWMDTFFISNKTRSLPCNPSSKNSHCLTTSISVEPIPWIMIEMLPESHPFPVVTPTLNVPHDDSNTQYHLKSIVYAGNHHFSIRFFDIMGYSWIHDGMLHAGKPIYEGIHCSEGQSLVHLQTMVSHLYVYVAT